VRELVFDLIYSLTGESSPPHTRKGRLVQAKVGKYVTLLICGLSRGNDRRRNLIADEEMRIKYPSSDHGARRAGKSQFLLGDFNMPPYRVEKLEI
jgi:hypothetical protein